VKRGGRKTHRALNPELVKLVKRLRWRNWKTNRQKFYRQISRILSEDYVFFQRTW